MSRSNKAFLDDNIKDEDANSENSDKARQRLAQALKNLENTKKPACPYLSSTAKQSLK